MALETRSLSGLPSWPVTLVAGTKSSGKTHLCVQASASPLISRTLWLGFGEMDPDDYGTIPGASVEVVSHAGTVKDLIEKVNEIADLPAPDEGVILIVIDSGTPVWETLSARVNAAKIARGPRAEGDKDLWDEARREWVSLLNALRRHKGPSIITARFEEATVYVGGEATDKKVWRVRAERDLPFEVGACIEMRERGEYLLTGVKSARMEFTTARWWPDFTMDALWREFGLADGDVGERSFAKVITDPDAALDKTGRDWLAELEACHTIKQVTELGGQASGKAGKEVMTAIRRKTARLTPTPPTGTSPAAQ
jgi:hypothetical protein